MRLLRLVCTKLRSPLVFGLGILALSVFFLDSMGGMPVQVLLVFWLLLIVLLL